VDGEADDVVRLQEFVNGCGIAAVGKDIEDSPVDHDADNEDDGTNANYCHFVLKFHQWLVLNNDEMKSSQRGHIV
jgi:hypothetical protein